MKHTRLKRLIFTFIKSSSLTAGMAIHEYLKIDYDTIETALQELFKEGKISTPDMWDIITLKGEVSKCEGLKYRVFYMSKKRYCTETYLHEDQAEEFVTELMNAGYKNVFMEKVGVA